ncbi:Rho GTPase activation protein [Lipomyces japonicus]|uniref:Rho GTPase activation protein n=1 Tax=Lipomyces japonicus TaxID=56871 RepID=UPI0034CFC036
MAASPALSHTAAFLDAGRSSKRSSMATSRQSKRYSVTALYVTMAAAEHDVDVDDALSRLQRRLRDLKAQISSQSKRNFLLERDVRYLDSRIALLIQNKIASEEQGEVTNHLEEPEIREGTFPDHDKLDLYGNLFFILQSEPRHIATLCRLLSMSEMDSFLQTVMFTIYGNQYEQREEHLLLSMFQSVLSTQFESTTEFSSLLRANTPVSRMMTTYTRRGPGQGYLKSVLAKKVSSLIDNDDLDLEVNPLKVYENLYRNELKKMSGNPTAVRIARAVSAEIAAENQQVKAIIQPRLARLLTIANSFLNEIIGSLETVPYGIRWICKQIRSFTRRKYPGTDDAAVCSLIGAFFFLRFINPAVVTPQSYMLVDGTPAENPRRILTLIAKMLQNLANKPMYSKEPYMASLSAFIEGNKARMNQFLNDLCEVPDFYETLEMDQYIALSKKELSLSITINEIYSMHGILEKYAQVVYPDSASHLSVILNELGPASAILPRAENYIIDLPLFSRFDSAVEHLGASLDITQSDVTFMEAKGLLVHILRSLPANHPSVTSQPLNLYKIVEAAATHKDGMLVKKGIRAATLLAELEDLGLLSYSGDSSGSDSNPLLDEIEEEIAQLGSLREKVLDELRSLESVYNTIRDHNDYLRGQLETYKSYLSNVRIQSGLKKSAISDRVGLVSLEGKMHKQPKSQFLGPYKFSQQVLQKEGAITVCNVPEKRIPNLYFNIASPTPGTFVISLHYKGRSRGLLELNLNLDDLLEMLKNDVEVLDLEYVIVNVPMMLDFLQRQFSGRK